jgi:hypothetical protein
MLTLVTENIPFGGDSNGFQGEQAQVCRRGRRGVHNDVKEATGEWR